MKTPAGEFAKTLVFIFCLCALEVEAQQTFVTIQGEDDVIANSVAQSIPGANKIIIAGPLVPLGTEKLPIIYTIRTELDGEKSTTDLVVTFDCADEYQVFSTILNEAGKKVATKPSLQQEVQGRKDTAYTVRLSDEYLRKISQAGLEWIFQGGKQKAKIKIPAFFFSGFLKKVADTKTAVKGGSTDDFLYRGSIGSSSPQSAKKEFTNIKDFAGETLIFVPLSKIEAPFGYGIKIKASDGKEIAPRDLVGKEIQLITVTESETRHTFFGVKFAGQSDLIVATSDELLNPLRGLVPKTELQEAKQKLDGKTLWLRSNQLLTYDAVAERTESHSARRWQPLAVERVVLGSAANPIRLVLQTQDGKEFFQEYSPFKGRFRDIGANTFEEIFYDEDPAKIFGWSDETIQFVEESKIQFGMTKDQVAASWGGPEKTNTVSSRGINLEQWVYRDQIVYFKDGKYIDYQNSSN